MKKLILVFSMVAGFMGAYAQQRFEGTILYSQTSKSTTRDKAPDLSVRFGKNAIRIVATNAAREEMDDLLIRLDSGMMYTLRADEKTFKAKPLINTESNREFVGPTEIAGYKVNTFNLADAGYSVLNAVMAKIGKVWLFPSKDLRYPVPVKYLQNMELCMIHDNQIVLGISIIDQLKSYSDSASSDTMTIQATSVKPEVFPDSVFEVPKDYTAYVEPVYNDMDSAAYPAEIVTDSAVDATYAVPEGPPAAPKKKTAVKKKAGAVKSPARKPSVKK
ncbi:hypothetical protein HHL16_13515 [Pseudoflavitalea sp. G-6-1-2]|uniref:hypothetical protein n=1 Tax=Pseudoflavitalea sp. G-6-1-2 TaxID=2728841 RepID=UPI00146B2B2D|nr:hypothetical protein [Pseudoflavitalea sp. G-6-1-2]NML21902.1 hypothetical protein [Pseudoflavitalea sp. G-6-1-2]